MNKSIVRSLFEGTLNKDVASSTNSFYNYVYRVDINSQYKGILLYLLLKIIFIKI